MSYYYTEKESTVNTETTNLCIEQEESPDNSESTGTEQQVNGYIEQESTDNTETTNSSLEQQESSDNSESTATEHQRNSSQITNLMTQENEEYESDFSADFSDDDTCYICEIDEVEEEVVKPKIVETERIDESDHVKQDYVQDLFREEPGPCIRRPRYIVKNTPVVRKTSAAINRERLQRKIDRENLALVNRIKSIKPFGLSKPPVMYHKYKKIFEK